MNYQYAYLILTALLFPIWAFLYLSKKEGRREVIIISFLFGIGGILSELVYVKDWWKPLTITNTLIGMEDFLFGFFIAGIASIIYSRVFHKKIKRENTLFLKFKYKYIAIFFVILFFGSFFILKNSFYASLLAFIFGISVIWIKRKDLIFNSIVSGILTLIIGIIVYFIMNFFLFGFIEQFWYLNGEWYSALLFGIPMREYIWYLLAGMFIGPLYEYMMGRKLINIKR